MLIKRLALAVLLALGMALGGLLAAADGVEAGSPKPNPCGTSFC